MFAEVLYLHLNGKVSIFNINLKYNDAGKLVKLITVIVPNEKNITSFPFGTKIANI